MPKSHGIGKEITEEDFVVPGFIGALKQLRVEGVEGGLYKRESWPTCDIQHCTLSLHDVRQCLLIFSDKPLIPIPSLGECLGTEVDCLSK